MSEESCDVFWQNKTDHISRLENYVETGVMATVSLYGLYVIVTVVIIRRLFDFFAIGIPLAIVAYAVVTVGFYFNSDFEDFTDVTTPSKAAD